MPAERPPGLPQRETDRTRRQAAANPTREERADIQRGIFTRTVGLQAEYPLPWTTQLGAMYPTPTGEDDHVAMLTFLPRVPAYVDEHLKRFIPKDGMVVAHFAKTRKKLNLLDIVACLPTDAPPPPNMRIRPPDTPLVDSIHRAAESRSASFYATVARGGTMTWKNMVNETHEFAELHGLDPDMLDEMVQNLQYADRQTWFELAEATGVYDQEP